MCYKPSSEPFRITYIPLVVTFHNILVIYLQSVFSLLLPLFTFQGLAFISEVHTAVMFVLLIIL
jgi:hypothetical protein